MSLKGSLEDVSVVDVIQLIYIGGRTGTLKVQGAESEARIGFQRGRIGNVWRTDAQRLGELLISEGLLSPSVLATALAGQQREVPRQSIGQILIAAGAVTEPAVNAALARHFGRLVREMVTWRRGNFEFVFDDVWPLDELAAFPGDATPKIALDTQMVLLEALSDPEELPRSGENAPRPGQGTTDEFADSKTPIGPSPFPPAKEAPGRSGPAPPEKPGPPRPEISSSGNLPAASPRVQLVTTDLSLADRLRDALRDPGARVTAVLAREAGCSLPGEPAPLVVVDLRGSGSSVESILALRRTRPKATIVAYGSPQTSPTRVYEAGAAALVHGDEVALAACVQGVFRSRAELSNEALIAEGLRDGFARFRRIVNNLRSGLLSTTVSLNLMNAVAESLERAILFVIQQDQLIPIGSFGLTAGREKLPDITHQLRLSLREPSLFSGCAESGWARIASYDEVTLPPAFRAVVSRPRSGDFAVLPVLGSQRVIAVIYVDNGSKDRRIPDLQVLELSAFQLGLALENEVLRRAQQSSRKPTSQTTTPLRNLG